LRTIVRPALDLVQRFRIGQVAQFFPKPARRLALILTVTPAVAYESRPSPRGVRVHRGLLQHASSALDSRLHEPRQVRSTSPQRRPSGSMIN
jgi:hypothetical protein